MYIVFSCIQSCSISKAPNFNLVSIYLFTIYDDYYYTSINRIFESHYLDLSRSELLILSFKLDNVLRAKKGLNNCFS